MFAVFPVDNEADISECECAYHIMEIAGILLFEWKIENDKFSRADQWLTVRAGREYYNTIPLRM